MNSGHFLRFLVGALVDTKSQTAVSLSFFLFFKMIALTLYTKFLLTGGFF